MMLLECGDDMIAIDAGLMFPEEDMLGIDLVIPNVAYIEAHREKFKAIFLTHGHEDHIGGLPYILRRVLAPIYCTPLTSGLLSVKLKEHHLLGTTDLRQIMPGETVSVGCFRVEAVQRRPQRAGLRGLRNPYACRHRHPHRRLQARPHARHGTGHRPVRGWPSWASRVCSSSSPTRPMPRSPAIRPQSRWSAKR